MKRLAALIAAILLSIPIAHADIPDFSAMTNAEIMDIINAGRNALYVSAPIEGELARRETDDGVTIIITNVRQNVQTSYVFIEMTLINNSDLNYRIVSPIVYVNGWDVYDYASFTVEAHRRSKESIAFLLNKTDINSINEVEDIEIRLSVCPNNAWDEIPLETVYLKR